MIKKANGKNIHAKMSEKRKVNMRLNEGGKKKKKRKLRDHGNLKRNEKMIFAELPRGFAKM